MQITSTGFQDKDELPLTYAKDGGNLNPPLTFSEIPPDAKSLALIVEDPDAPGKTFTHWLIYNMSPGTIQIPEGSLPMSGEQGLNDWGEKAYGGPQPPSGTHRYFFKLFALDTNLPTTEGMTRDRLYELMEGHIIEEAELVGLFSAEN